MRWTLSTLLLVCACPGTLEIVGHEPLTDDDSVGGDDDSAPGDDDSVVDDDSVPDDDSTPEEFDWSEVVLHGALVGSQHHPEGRWTWGYVYGDDQSTMTGVRGGDDPCSVSGSASGARGAGAGYGLGEVVTWSWDGGNEPWRLEMVRVEEQGFTYYYKDAAVGPRGLPPAAWLDLEIQEDDVPALTLPGILETPPAFEVERPSVPDGEEVLVIAPEDGLGFQWSSLGEDWVELAVSIDDWWGNNTTVTCYVPDSGSFVIAPEWLNALPQSIDGSAWVRRYRQTLLPPAPQGPGLELTSARQHDWTVRFESETMPPGPTPGG